MTAWERIEADLGRNKWFISLTCLLLFIAAVDTIPDPLAVNPPTSHSTRIAALHVQTSVTVLEKEWYWVSSALRCARVDWLTFRRAVDDVPARICTIPRIYHATDTSPPSFS